MKSIEKRIEDSIKKINKKFELSPEIKDFEKVNAEFESWVKLGIVSKRGNHLLASSENHLKPQVWFNVKPRTIVNPVYAKFG